jgi:hypothetical protein
MTNLIQIHIGKELPNYIYDSLYQSLLINTNVIIYVLIDSSLINEFNNKISLFNINTKCIKVVALTSTGKSKKIEKYTEYMKKFPRESMAFRNSFWVSTTARFFYIEEFMKNENLNDVFHIENDVMLYEDLCIIKETLNKEFLYMVQDNIARVVPSILFIPNVTELSKMNDFILNKIRDSNMFLNDMNLLGMYPNKELFPFHFNTNSKYIFDGAAIGQYLGGVDPNNLPKQNTQKEELLKCINNPSKFFVNETSDFKINDTILFFRKNTVIENNKEIDLIYGKEELESTIKIKQICNLHVHSKQLYQFSSVFDIKYNDIITGDRVLSLCDFIISTPEIYNYHQNSGIDPNKFILIQNFKNINTVALNKCFDKTHIKLFIYTHILDYFIEYILDYLPKNIKFTIYLHNSDHDLNERHTKLINDKRIVKIFSQNINCEFNDKINLLPIGLANSMFIHGDILSLYVCMSKTYKNKKTKNLYININPNTFAYRSQVLNEVTNDRFKISSGKPFQEYLEELSTHRFCLCVRGGGEACHRDWESLYLGVIPVFINNKFTNMNNHISYFKKLNLPFYEITEENFDKYSDDFFSESLYNKIIKKCGSSIYNLDALKLSYYS